MTLFVFGEERNIKNLLFITTFKKGAPVVTTRAHLQHIITEYGAVNLYGKSLKERATLTIGLAHLDDREALTKDAFELFKIKV
jgi:acyl-CoA hydrolase